ncbi:error-prone DNA polymerase [Rhodoplanes sp. Z2-YC6860]|uniref:error-prone DNA polymerase n=1 Tax=Rhodoplanes sp. Z2-YC6860 TaxID=674703 RepID=UPI00078B980C|nr:error-prone DNA polymerase [Rhodoplanes sp. Z2-YC6860]AMN44896.1 DNA polymerase III alpha subunit [Rhodoplanes sp. Z2-YC6860]
MSAYAELAVTTNFSFLRGASDPEELVFEAKRLGHAGIGIADRNSVAGVVRALTQIRAFVDDEKEAWDNAARKDLPEEFKPTPFKLAVGTRLVFADDTPDILAYPRDRAAWGRLTRLLSAGKRRAEKGCCTLWLPDLLDHIEGLNLIVVPPPRIHAERLGALLAQLKEAAPRSVWLAAGMLYRGDDVRRLERLASIADSTFVPLIAINDVLYHAAERRSLQDVVTCIREHLTLEEAGRRLEANAERHLKTPDEMARMFRRVPKAIRETQRFLSRCNFSLEELRATEYADETRQGYATPQEALVAFAEAGLKRRYGDQVPEKVRHALSEELRLIGELKYAPFFLTVDEIVKFARSLPDPILCQGRGSAANSVICFCLGITDVEPTKIDLLFERFVSAERREPPDIDVDFEHERREEVIQHIYEKYGRERAGLAATVICYRGRSAIREVGKVFGLSADTIAALAKTLWGWSSSGVSEQEARRSGLDPSDPRLKQAMQLAEELIGAPRHLSQHVGGFVITRSRLDEVVPIENAAMDDRTVIEWEKDDLEAIGLLKVDVLALGMLSCLKRSFDFLKSHYDEPRDLSMQDEDGATYRMIQRADTIGVFQIESRAQMSMLPRLKPKEFYDLVIEVAIVRPGPIQGNMVHPYLRRREGLDPIVYPSPELENILRKTLGVPLFQEHAMRIAIVGAGFEPGEADRLRRAMATFKRVGTIDRFRNKFIDGMVVRGYDKAFAANCWQQIEGFGSYGFPESHAASFANLVYASAWVKCHYPDVFAAAILNSQPMGFYATAQLVRDAQEHGVEARPPDVNHSNWDCTLEDRPQGTLHARHTSMADDLRTRYALRLGFRQIDGFSEEWGKTIEQVRREGFDSVRDLWLRTGLPPKALERLAHADAFRSLGLTRRDALWAVKALRRAGDKDDLPLFAQAAMPEREPDAHLPSMPPGQQVIEDYRHLHLSLSAHPVSFFRADLDAQGIVPHGRLPEIPNGHRVTIAGLVLVRQRPGVGNAIFMTLEDETGIANTILWPRTFERFRPIVMGSRLIGVSGLVQNEKSVIHIVGESFIDLSPLLLRLSEEAQLIDPTLPVDEVKRPVQGSWRHPRQTLSPADMARADNPDRFRHPRSGDSFVRLAKNKPALEHMAAVEHAAKVMPKGRNFH